jgi:putative Mg2+ transporter-C (MgtC) family protein
VVALVLGAAIGIERERGRHPAGFRTMAMVSVGSCLFTLLGGLAFGSRIVDPTRIAAQVVTGVGFLGAGAILRERGAVRGLTTAAAIWVVAAIGMAAGFGQYVLAVGGTVIVLLALTVLRVVRARFFRMDEEEEEREEGGQA